MVSSNSHCVGTVLRWSLYRISYHPDSRRVTVTSCGGFCLILPIGFLLSVIVSRGAAHNGNPDGRRRERG